MAVYELAATRLVDGVPALRLLEGLARLYELVLVFDHDRRVLWISNALDSLCGGADFRIGSDVRSILPELPRLTKPEQVFALRSQFRRDGYLSNARIEAKHRDGGVVPLEVNMLPIETADAAGPLTVVIARKVEERHGPLRDFQRAGGTPGAILDSAPDAVLVVDEGGYVTYANRAVEKLVGSRPDQLVDRPVAILVSNVSELERFVSALRSGHEIRDENLTLRRGDGATVEVSASASTLALEAPRLRGTVLSLRDVTKRRKAESALAHQNDELEHCVHTLAHDLRSPLVALLGFSRLLRQDYAGRLDDTGLHFLDRIERAGRTMEDLIHDLLELSRIGQPGERRAMVDLRAVLQQLHGEYKPRLEAGGIRLELPEHPPPLYCDRTRLYQVLSNLIGNAIDHMGSCDDPCIRVSVAEDPAEHVVSVRDFGRGIDPEHHTRVFEVFQSLGPASDGRRGTGIGLAIVKRIAETHGGRVWLESEPGRGADFRVSFPHR